MAPRTSRVAVRPESAPRRCSPVTMGGAILVMTRLVGVIRLSMAQATPPPSTGRRRVAGSRPPWPGPRGGCLGLGSCGEGRSLPDAPALTPQAQIRPPIRLLSGQESRRRGDRPVILTSAHGPTAIQGRSRTQPRVSPARPRTTTRDGIDHPGGLIAYMPVLLNLGGDAVGLHLLLSQIQPFGQQSLPQEDWPGGQQRPMALLQFQPFGQQSLPQEDWPGGQQRPVALLQLQPFGQQRLPQGVSPGGHLISTARAVPDPKTETSAAPEIPRRMCANACRRGIGLARVRAMSSNSLFSFMPLPPLLKFSLPPSPRGRAPGSRRLPARRP